MVLLSFRKATAMRAVKAKQKKESHPLLRLVDPKRVPSHVAIIMDGNGRWAKSRGLARIEGHKAGIEAVREAIAAASNLGVKHLTLYAFSIENWKRPAAEVRALFALLERFINSESKEILERDIRFRTIGRLDDLPTKTRRMLRALVERTADAKSWTLTLALSYGGRTEIADACDAIVREALHGARKGPVTEEDVARHLYARDLPDPDLLIRTSGEYRVSNFLLWQIAYTELAILDILWPDFKEQHFYEAVLDYQRRERRYGGVSVAEEAHAGEGRKEFGP
jgi:undecaprenyl diphosphate synthase